MNDTKIEYWSYHEECDFLTKETPDEAIEEALDELDPKDWGDTITVIGFCRKRLDAKGLEGFLIESALDYLEDEYGDPDGSCFLTATDALEKAEKVFIEVLQKEVEVLVFEPCEAKTVNVRDWVTKHCPHWLEESKVQDRFACEVVTDE